MQHWSDSGPFSPSNDKVISIAHAADSLDDFGLVVFNNFDPFELLPEENQQEASQSPGSGNTYDSQ